MEHENNKNEKRRIICEQANFLVYQRGFNRSKAFKCAHILYRFAEWLAKGIVAFTYMKDDGSIRHARGTLCDEVSEKFDEWKRKQAEKPKTKEPEDSAKHVIKYWDVDKEAFRSFKAENLLLSNTDKTHETNLK
jgi:hypothetical protein